MKTEKRLIYFLRTLVLFCEWFTFVGRSFLLSRNMVLGRCYFSPSAPWTLCPSL